MMKIATTKIKKETTQMKMQVRGERMGRIVKIRVPNRLVHEVELLRLMCISMILVLFHCTISLQDTSSVAPHSESMFRSLSHMR